MLTGLTLPFVLGPLPSVPPPRTPAAQTVHDVAYAAVIEHGAGCPRCWASQECAVSTELFTELRRRT